MSTELSEVEKQNLEFNKIQHQQWLNQPHTILTLKKLLETRDKLFEVATNHAISGNKKLALTSLIQAGTVNNQLQKITNVEKFFNT